MKSSWKKQRQATKKRQIKNIRIVKFYLGSECWLYYKELEKNCPECGYIMGYYENFDGCYYSCSRCDFQEEDWMKKENLDQINKIDREIKEIDNFLYNYGRKNRSIGLSIFKQDSFLSMKLKGYGVLGEIEIALSSELNGKLIEMVQEYRKSLVGKQDRLWGQEWN